MRHDLYRIPPDLAPQLQACLDEAGIAAEQLRWSDSPCQGFRRCQVLWLSPHQSDRLEALLSPRTTQ